MGISLLAATTVLISSALKTQTEEEIKEEETDLYE